MTKGRMEILFSEEVWIVRKRGGFLTLKIIKEILISKEVWFTPTRGGFVPLKIDENIRIRNFDFHENF